MMTDFLGGKKRMPSALLADPRDAKTTRLADENHRLTAEVARLTESLRSTARTWAETDEALGRERDNADWAAAEVGELRDLLRDTEALLLPILPAGMFADDPMPADGEPWPPVPGDAHDLPALVEVSATELAEVAP